MHENKTISRLADNHIDDVGAQSLSFALKKNTVLIELDLAGRQKTNEIEDTKICSVHIALALVYTKSNREQDWGNRSSFIA